jgi:hypothetical protein
MRARCGMSSAAAAEPARKIAQRSDTAAASVNTSVAASANASVLFAA